MKERWEYMRLGDVGTVITGSTPSTKDAQNYSSNDVCFVKPSDIDKNEVSFINETEFHLSRQGFNSSRKLPRGSVLTTCIGIIGKVGILQREASCNQQINAVIPNHLIISPFLAFSILGLRQTLESMANAPVVPIINKTDFSNVLIPIPPISEQESIVAELDLLQGIIHKQKAQLKELDILAQSLYYDMFGTTLKEKGWTIKKLGDIGTFQRGGGFLKSDYVDNGFPCIHYGQIHTKLGIATYHHLTSIPENLAVTKSKLAETGDVILAITSEDVEGSCKCTAWMGKYPVAVGGHAAIYKHSLNPIYAAYSFKSDYFQKAKEKYAHGFKVVEIKPSDIASINVCVPPRELQSRFADSILSIEQQKAKINRSIVETQTLFDYTMDKYFG